MLILIVSGRSGYRNVALGESSAIHTKVIPSEAGTAFPESRAIQPKDPPGFSRPVNSLHEANYIQMAGHECYHCRQWVAQGEPHDCWSTTEAALTRHLSDDLREAWERLRETAAAFGEQRIYASHHSIMFSRKTCYFFVRPKQKYLELCVFLGRRLKAPQVRRADQASKTKLYHLIRITHRDEVEPPITDWLQEAYTLSNQLSKPGAAKSTHPGKQTAGRKSTSAQQPVKAQRKAPAASKLGPWSN